MSRRTTIDIESGCQCGAVHSHISDPAGLVEAFNHGLNCEALLRRIVRAKGVAQTAEILKAREYMNRHPASILRRSGK